MVVRLCAPSIQRLRARNWNFAIEGSALIASSVPYSCWESTPLRMISAVVLIDLLLGSSSGAMPDRSCLRRVGATGVSDRLPEVVVGGVRDLGNGACLVGIARGGRSREAAGFFFNDTATTEIYTLSLHDALPIPTPGRCPASPGGALRSGRESRGVGA